MTEGHIEGTPKRGRRSPQLQAELDAAAAIEAETEPQLSDAQEAVDQVGEVLIIGGDRLFLKASIPYKLHGPHEDSSYFTTAYEARVSDDDDLDEVYREVRDIVLRANTGLAQEAQALVDQETETRRRTPIRPRG